LKWVRCLGVLGTPPGEWAQFKGMRVGYSPLRAKTLRIVTFSMTTLREVTFSITRLTIKGLFGHSAMRILSIKTLCPKPESYI
jgi:hypothetical protein